MPDNLPATSAPARTLGEFACGLTFEHIPAAVLERAKLLILDALGCGIASNAYGFSDAALAGATALGGVGRCSVIGRANRLPVRDAALVNGMLIHGLDFDDTHLASIIHATAACLPTALTFGEELDVDGRVLLVAYAAGMETAIRVGAAAKGGFHHTGFHATGVVAHFSASVVAARLLNLPSEAIVAAQGIAASTASGVQVFLEEGAWTKRMHPGWAAVAGITAARLAQHGFRAPARSYEGKFGFFDTHLQHAPAPHRPAGRTRHTGVRLGARRDRRQTLPGLPLHPRLRRCGYRPAPADRRRRHRPRRGPTATRHNAHRRRTT